jgi:DNA-binding CsgD family transcriptional regulator
VLFRSATLLGEPITNVEAMRSAGDRLFERYGVPILLKGGHLGGDAAIDLLFDGDAVAELSGPVTRGVHTHVPLYMGLAQYHLATGDYQRAIDTGETGLAIADQTGYVAWAIHRLLPALIEAALKRQDVDLARRYGDRLLRDSTRTGHRLGIAWAHTADALIAMMKSDWRRAATLLAESADELEAVPWMWDAGRLRRYLAEVLFRLGDRDGAVRELRRSHDTLARLQAEPELSRTRELLRRLGARPPARAIASGSGALTGRELDIARLVASRKSNKEIAVALGISPRTVSTHVSNIFAKLSVSSRAELTEMVRTGAL